MMQLGRIGVGVNGRVYIGSVESNYYRIYTSNTDYTYASFSLDTANSIAVDSDLIQERHNEEVKDILDYIKTFNQVIIAGLMDKIYNNKRLIDHLIDELDTQWVTEHVIPSLNIVYASEKNRIIGYNTIFKGGDTHEIARWTEQDIKNYTSGALYTLSKIALDATLDFILTSSTPDRYNQIMAEARSEYDKIKHSETKSKKKLSDVFASSEIAAYWEHSVKVGEVFRAGIGQDAGLLISRDRSKGLFTDVDDSRFYIINLFGFKNRLRFGSKISLGSLIELITQQKEKYPLEYIHDNQSVGFQKACDIAHNNLTRRLQCSRSYAEYLQCSNEFIEAYKGLIAEVKKNIGAHIYEVTSDYMSFAVDTQEDMGKAIKVILEAAIKYMPNMFEVISIDTNGFIPKYWKFDTINCIPLNMLSDALKNNPNMLKHKNRIGIAMEFEKIKEGYNFDF